ncbi:MAG: hypothetical protein ACLQE9_07720 [Roseiarcus sp.]
MVEAGAEIVQDDPARAKIGFKAERLALSGGQIGAQSRDFGAPVVRSAFERHKHRGLTAEVGAMAPDRLLQSRNPLLQSMLRDGMLGAEHVALGDRLLDRERRRHPRARRRQTPGPARKSGRNNKPHQPCDEEAGEEKHCLFDQFALPELATGAQHRTAPRRSKVRG